MIRSDTSQLKCWNCIGIFVIVMTGSLLVFSCAKEETENNLARDFQELDAFLRDEPFHYESLKDYLASVSEGLIHSEKKHMGYEKKKTAVHYQWNSDSSLILINSYKSFAKGFSREEILHAGDSILFIHRFSTEPLSLENPEDYTFLESIYYLAETGTLRHLSRIEYNMRDLSDTVAFRRKPFTEIADNISHYYSLELNYSKNIFTLN